LTKSKSISNNSSGTECSHAKNNKINESRHRLENFHKMQNEELEDSLKITYEKHLNDLTHNNEILVSKLKEQFIKERIDKLDFIKI
jgi:hypothetical protein